MAAQRTGPTTVNDQTNEALPRESTVPRGSEQVEANPVSSPVTIRTIERLVAKNAAFPALTCYDYTTARWLQQAGVPVLLVGDSAGEVILGEPSTIHAPLEFLLTLTAAVKRGAPNCLVMGDMPFMSYQADEAEAIHNAGRFLTDGRADIVKLEVDRSFAALIERMDHAGIPVVAHLGLKPQHVKREGGYRYAGRTATEARELIATAATMQDAGATMLLLEAMPAVVAQRIVEKVQIPVIGCGAGPACHGQIVVIQDILGLSERQPPFARPVEDLGGTMMRTVSTWCARVRAREMGEHPYRMNEGEVNRI